MAAAPQFRPSFSPRRRWSIALDVFVRTVVVLAVVVMVNYLGARYFHREFLSSKTQVALSPRTVSLVKSITNQVKITLYYDKEDPLYATLAALLKEYCYLNPRLRVVTVDYLRDAPEAQKLKSAYKLGELSAETEKSLVIFECEGRTKIVNGKALAEYQLVQVPNKTQLEFERKVIASNGERMFTSYLIAVTSPKPLNAYFLQGHGEHRPDSGDDLSGYLTFASILAQNYIRPVPLTLLGSNSVPADCNLLIIAGPTTMIPEVELQRIEQYLNQGGRLLALFNSASKDRRTGLERILLHWNVIVGESEVSDPDNTIKGPDVVVQSFSKHPVVNPLLGSALHLILPRPVGRRDTVDRSAEAPTVEEIAASGPRAHLASDPARTQRRFPLAVAVEKGAVKNVIAERGSTRMVVVGDSFFLCNRQIESAGNRDFATYAANWLLDRPQLLEGLGPQPVNEFRLTMTKSQLQAAQWILLAAMPGAILALGGLVWLRRRR